MQRCLQAQQAGIYVDVILSGAWTTFENPIPDPNFGNRTGWDFAYWNPVNNEMADNSVSEPQAYTTSASTEWRNKMKNFMHKMIDTVYDLDNVVFEITNEGKSTTFEWQEAVIDELHMYEDSPTSDNPTVSMHQPLKHHLIGFTAAPGGTSVDNNHTYLESNADWVSLSNDGLASAVPGDPATISPNHVKPDVLDTDHTFGIGGNVDYLWSSMMRGHNNIYMDNYGQHPGPNPPHDVPAVMHSVMGAQRPLADRCDLIHMFPLSGTSIVSTGYALAHKTVESGQPDGVEYLIWQPNNSSVTVSLPAGTYRYEWINPVTGDIVSTDITTYATAGNQTFPLPPAPNDTRGVLHLKAQPIAVSRKTHGSAGTFDVLLPLTGTAGIECRSDGVSNDHQMIITFPTPVTFSSASITSGNGSVQSSNGSGTSEVTVNLTGVTNAQTIVVTLSGVNDGTPSYNVSVPMGVLVGDASGNGAVSGTDASQVKTQSGMPVTASNFRNDLSPNGTINGTDVSIAKTHSGTGLP
jgi:hypothetical protein